jgi:lactoylglutathione lyase
VNEEVGLDGVYEKLKNTDGVTIEFAPENLGGGPTKHMMIPEPGGIRIEFIAPAK